MSRAHAEMIRVWLEHPELEVIVSTPSGIWIRAELPNWDPSHSYKFKVPFGIEFAKHYSFSLVGDDHVIVGRCKEVFDDERATVIFQLDDGSIWNVLFWDIKSATELVEKFNIKGLENRITGLENKLKEMEDRFSNIKTSAWRSKIKDDDSVKMSGSEAKALHYDYPLNDLKDLRIIEDESNYPLINKI